MKFKTIYVCWMLLSLSVCSLGQDTLKSVWTENAIEVVASYDSESSFVNQLDSLDLQFAMSSNLGDALFYSGVRGIQLYGAPGAIIQTRQGGLSADHTTVLWEGIPINSPTLGSADLSLIPIYGNETVSISSVGNPSSSFVGFVADAISISSRVKNSNSIGLTTSFNSLNNLTSDLNLNLSKGKWNGILGVKWQEFKNEFQYENIYFDGSIIDQEHNNNSSYSINGKVNCEVNENALIAIGGMHLKSDYQIPNTMGSMSNVFHSQSDEVTRVYARYNHYFENFTFKFQQSLSQEFQLWGEDQIFDAPAEEDFLRILSAYSDLNLSFKNEKLKVDGGGLLSFNSAKYQYYETNPERKLLSPFINVEYLIRPKISVNASTKRDFGIERSKFTSLFQFKYEKQNVKARAGYSAIFRNPDFNELYWVGYQTSESIRPENGNKVFAALFLNTPITKDFGISFSIESSYTHLYDWIVWGYFEDVNGEQVLGVYNRDEAEVYNVKSTLGLVKKTSVNSLLRFESTIDLAKSIDISTGHSLSYTPAVQGHLLLSYSHNNFQAFSRLNYIGERFTDANETQAFALSPIYMFDIGLSKRFKAFNGLSFDARIEAKNLFNKYYEVVRGYAIPGEYFQATLKIEFVKSNNQ